MLVLNGRLFKPLCKDPDGDGGSGGSGGGSGGGSSDKKPDPDGKGGKSKDGGGQGGDDGGNDDLPDDESKWTSEQTKSYIQKLRKENKSYRTRFQSAETKIVGLDDRFSRLESGLKKLAGGGDDDGDDTVEAKLARLEAREVAREESEAITTMNKAVETTAKALGVPDSGLDYFKFLIHQEAEQMEDEEVLGEELLASLAKKAIAQTGDGKGTTTSADGKEGKKTPKPEGKTSGTTVEQFAKMTIAERSALYQTNKDEYTKLMQEAKDKKLLFQ